MPHRQLRRVGEQRTALTGRTVTDETGVVEVERRNLAIAANECRATAAAAVGAEKVALDAYRTGRAVQAECTTIPVGEATASGSAMLLVNAVTDFYRCGVGEVRSDGPAGNKAAIENIPGER